MDYLLKDYVPFQIKRSCLKLLFNLYIESQNTRTYLGLDRARPRAFEKARMLGAKWDPDRQAFYLPIPCENEAQLHRM